MESPSINNLIHSTLASQKPSKFAFVTITNPNDIKDSKKQTVIRRHARASTASSKQQRRKHAKLVFDLPDTTSQVTIETNATFVQSNKSSDKETVEDETIDHSDSLTTYEMPWSSLRPLGAGRGLSPLQPFPVAVTSRDRDLVNFGLNTTHLSLRVCLI